MSTAHAPDVAKALRLIDEAAHKFATPANRHVLIAHLTEMSDDRDALLAALRDLLARAEAELADPEDVGDVLQARAVIARIDGRTP